MKATIEAFDARAEGLKRSVEVSPERVVIARRVNGVDMRVALAPENFAGVLLSVLVIEETDFLYQVRLVHADPELSVTLGDFGDEDDARALWRSWASALRLARLVERADGEYEVDRAPPALANPFERRRGRATLRRRNRFLARRKMGRTQAPVAATAGEA